MARLTLLNPSDPDPVRSFAPDSPTSPFMLVGDHAGAAIPAALGDLGLQAEDRRRHISLDIGSEQLGIALARRLHAPFLMQSYSRLVVDCNRNPADPGSIAEDSDGTPVPGNRYLSDAERDARLTEIFQPYHRAIEAMLDRRRAQDRATVFVSLHSFTPVLNGHRRPWEIGVLHDGHRDDLALRLLNVLGATGRVIGDNEPYAMDSTDYTVPAHAFSRDLPYVEIEVRQDLLAANPEGLARLLGECLEAAL